jgi:hypothetical protein
MIGNLTLKGNPTTDLGAATKKYVDDKAPKTHTHAIADIAGLSGALTAKLSLSGGTMTGTLTLKADPAQPLEAATKKYVDAADSLKLPLAGGTMTGNLILNGAPTVDLQAATKKYVDDNNTLALLSDTDLTTNTPTTGMSLVYDATNKWVPKNISPTVGNVVMNRSGTGTGISGIGDAWTSHVSKPLDPIIIANYDGAAYVKTGAGGDDTDWVSLGSSTAYLPLAGGTMIGNLTLKGNPTTDLGAATKKYVDDKAPKTHTHAIADITGLSGALTAKLSLSGGTMTGTLTLKADPAQPLEAATKKYVDAADSLKLPLAGGTMTGNLILNGAPTADLQAATKKYVDDTDALKLALAGGTMTGTLTLKADPTQQLEAATKRYVDAADSLKLALAGGTMTGKLVLDADPTTNMEAATKHYVDDQIRPLKSYNVRNEVSATYTLDLDDAGSYLKIDNANPVTITVPPFSAVAYPMGTAITINQSNDGQITVAPGTGVTLHSPYSLKTAQKYSTITLIKVDVNEWDVSGDLE